MVLASGEEEEVRELSLEEDARVEEDVLPAGNCCCDMQPDPLSGAMPHRPVSAQCFVSRFRKEHTAISLATKTNESGQFQTAEERDIRSNHCRLHELLSLNHPALTRKVE